MHLRSLGLINFRCSSSVSVTKPEVVNTMCFSVLLFRILDENLL